MLYIFIHVDHTVLLSSDDLLMLQPPRLTQNASSPINRNPIQTGQGLPRRNWVKLHFQIIY